MKQKLDKTVAIIGLGYVGLRLACLCAKKGYKTYAIDIDKEKIRLIKKGVSPIKDEKLIEDVAKVKLIATSDIKAAKGADIIIVCVPTPVKKDFSPDLKPLKQACKDIIKHLNKGDLVIIESTINPGVCTDIVKPILETSGLAVGRDIYLAHCPERIDPGNKNWHLRNIPRVLGASSGQGLKKALTFYKDIIEAEIMPMQSLEEAEATKIIENTFRDVNIAFVNELAKSFDRLGIDISRVLKGAATKPFAFIPHYPGCGIGGHCIPVDPYYLIMRAKQGGFNHKFLKLAREINNSMPAYTVSLLTNALKSLDKPVKGLNIGILGLAYKPNVEDTRESPSLKIIELLKKSGANLHIYDPFVKDKSTVESLDQLLEKSEALILATAHSEFVDMDLKKLKDNKIKIIIDGRNCLDKDKIKKLGIVYKGIGR